MIGVILCTHSEFAEGLKKAVEMIAGKQENFEAISFMDGDDLDELMDKLKTAGERYKLAGIPYCYVVDLYGATPFNQALRASVENAANIIAGASLPLLLTLLTSRESYDGDNLNEFLTGVLNEAVESMCVIDSAVIFGDTSADALG